MPREFSRSQRMGEQLRRELADIVRNEVRDPRLGFLSFTEVRVSRDLGHALVFCSVMQEDEREPTLAALNHASGYIRKLIGQRIRARIIPTLKFVLDDSLERGMQMDELIRRAREEDAQRNAARDADETDN